jgi:hypothetical protein
MSDQPTLFDQLNFYGTPTIEESEHSKIKWSYSRRETFDRCLRQYYYQYYGANQRTAKAEPYKDKLKFLKELSNELSLMSQEREPGIAVFVFENEDPTTYSTIFYELKSWRVKRITYDPLIPI